MLEWMQKHKKYLVLTVWVSVIALVFAGIVEWGHGGLFERGDDKVAKVGNEYITKNEFDIAFSNYLNAFSNSEHGHGLDEESAKAIGLDKLVLDELIRNKLLLIYSEDLGISVTPNEIASYLSEIPELQTNGVFDKELYISMMRSQRRKPADVEEDIRKQLMATKLMNLISIPPTNLESDSLASALNIKTSVMIKFLSKSLALSGLNFEPSENDIRSYWENNKDKYKSKIEINMAYINIPFSNIPVPKEEDLRKYFNENKHNYTIYTDFSSAKYFVERDFINEKAQNIAKLAYVYLRDQEKKIINQVSVNRDVLEYNSKEDVDSLLHSIELGTELHDIKIHFGNFKEDSESFSELSMEIIKNSSGLVEPTENGDSIIIPYVISKTKPEILDYKQARSLSVQDVINNLKNEKFSEYAKQELSKKKNMINLEGISFLNLNHDLRIEPLTQDEIQKAFISILTESKKEGVIQYENGALIYYITSQEFPKFQDVLRSIDSTNEIINNNKRTNILSLFFDHISSKYKVIRY